MTTISRIVKVLKMPVREAAREVGRALRKVDRRLEPYKPYLLAFIGPVCSVQVVHQYGKFDIFQLDGADFIEVEVTNDLGIHARSAGEIKVLSSKFRSEIRMVGATEDACSEHTADCKKVMMGGILGLYDEGIPKGSKILIYAKGEDQKQAIEALRDLFASKGYGEIKQSTLEDTGTVVSTAFQMSAKMPAIPRITLGHIVRCDEELNVERYAGFDLKDDPRHTSGQMPVKALCDEKIGIVREAFAVLRGQLEAGDQLVNGLVPQLDDLLDAVTRIMDEQKVNAAKAVGILLESKRGMRTSPDDKVKATFWSIYKMLAKMLLITHRDIRDFNDEVNRTPHEHVIIVCDDLADSDSGLLDNHKVRGLIRKHGSRIDHIGIGARNREIGSMNSLGEDVDRLQDGDFVIIDECEGKVIVNPDEATIATYRLKKEKIDSLKDRLKEMRERPAQTRCGRRLHLLGNIVTPEEIERMDSHGMDGVGLVRTIIFYAVGADKVRRNEAPSEAEQRAYYSALVDRTAGKRLIIRTIDPAADKGLPYFKPLYASGITDASQRMSGIQVCLDRENFEAYYNLFVEQLTHILRTPRQFDVMFPMVRQASDFGRAMALIESIKEDLSARGIFINNEIRFGSMIEHPDILKDFDALLADERMRFVSFGTSDLTEFITGVRRRSSALSAAFDEKHPAVLKFIKEATERAKAAGKDVSCCGDMGNDWRALLWLWGTGIETVSISAGMVDLAKKIAEAVSLEELKVMVHQVFSASTPEEVRREIENFALSKIRGGGWGALEDFKPLLFPRDGKKT